MKNNVSFIFETAVVKRLERTGWQILGDNQETVGEHSFMTAVIAYLLVCEVKKTHQVNMEKVLLMSLFHDFHESRTGDVDKISTFYVNRDEGKANRDIFGKVDPDLEKIVTEYEKKESTEAKIVYEANILALLVELKQLVEKGNSNAGEWLTGNAKRLRLKESIELAREITSANSQDWWKDIRKELNARFSQ